ncbi:MAG: TonB-dependent receptor [Bacteroidota bacterium]
MPQFKTMLLLFCIILLLPQLTYSQEKVTVNGYIKDAKNGETLIGATIYARELDKGTTSNVYGFYSLSLPPGSYTFLVNYLGFEQSSIEANLATNQTLDIELSEETQALEEVVVVGEKENENLKTTEMSVEKLNIQTIQKMPALLGEVDVVRSIQLLPGVTTVGEGASGFNVRGGSIDQNLVLIDEAPVYNSSHLFGFFSVFNPDAVKDVKLYKGGIPARYGGRLSSILDVRMKEGNNKKFNINGGIGSIFSRLSVEGPIIKDKASFIIAGRRSYIDILSRPFLSEDQQGTALNFYDLTLKTNYKVNERNRIFLSGYLGRDNFRFGDAAGFNWGNATATLRWNHLYSDKLFSNLTLYYSNYDYELNFGDEDDNKFDWDANIVNFSVKPEFSYYLNPDNLLTFGGQAIVYTFDPGNAVGVSEGEAADISLPPKYGIESGLFIENEQKLNSSLSLNYGLRFSHFNYTGKGTAFEFEDREDGLRRETTGSSNFDQWESIQTYANFEPRFSINYEVNSTTSVKASYNRTVQYIHLISNSTASTPVDVWTPSTNNIRPQKAHQVALGLNKNFKDNTYIVTTEVYYKDYDQLVDYIEGAQLFLNPLLEGELLEGIGRAYGWELQVEKKKGRFTGWLSYTLARTERKVPGINNNDWFAARFDQTHNLSASAFYDFSDRFSIAANFVLNTGTPATFPTSRIEQQGFAIPYNSENSRNNVRIPAYHRLDISATLKGKKKPGKRFQGEWVFSIYNLYNRRNAFSIFFRQQEIRPKIGTPITTEAVRLSVVGNFIPSITYNFKF